MNVSHPPERDENALDEDTEHAIEVLSRHLHDDHSLCDPDTCVALGAPAFAWQDRHWQVGLTTKSGGTITIGVCAHDGPAAEAAALDLFPGATVAALALLAKPDERGPDAAPQVSAATGVIITGGVS